MERTLKGLTIFPGVYDPAEDSYLLLEVVEKVITPGTKVLEIGTGSGLIAINLASSGAEVYATDIDITACRCARANASLNGVNLDVIRADLFNGIRGRFEMILFNPPYLPLEGDDADHPAWSGGVKGCEVATRFLRDAKHYLAPEGKGFLVFSSLGGVDEVLRVLQDYYQWRVVAEKRFDFERVFVIEFSRRQSQGSPTRDHIKNRLRMPQHVMK